MLAFKMRKQASHASNHHHKYTPLAEESKSDSDVDSIVYKSTRKQTRIRKQREKQARKEAKGILSVLVLRFHQLKRRRKLPTIHPPPRPPFLQLPEPILVFLLRTLPGPAAANLSLTCRTLWALAGAASADVRPLSQLLTTRDERWEFLRPQQAHKRNRVLCYECARFHRREYPQTTVECYRDRCYWFRYDFYDTIEFMRVADMMHGQRYGYGSGPNNVGFSPSDFEYNFRELGMCWYGIKHSRRCLRMRVVDDMAICNARCERGASAYSFSRSSYNVLEPSGALHTNAGEDGCWRDRRG